MADDPDDLYLEDASDERTRAFVARENERVAPWLEDEVCERDRAYALSVFESDDKLFACRQRGAHLYDFHRGPDHPRGLWRRIPAIRTPQPDAPWEPVFDLDAHCVETGEEWAWRGVANGRDPTRVMVHLAQGGSDVGVHREFDLDALSFVRNGFETPPSRGHVEWQDANTLLAMLSTPGHATSSGWPATVRRWRRDEPLDDAEVLLRADKADLAVHAYAVGEGNDALVSLSVMHDINGQQTLAVLGGHERREIDLPNPRYAVATAHGVLWQPLEDVPFDAGAHKAGTLLHRSLPNEPGKERVLFEPGERRTVEHFVASDRWAHVLIHGNLVPELYMLDMRAPERGVRQVRLPDGVERVSAIWLHADPDAAGDHTLLIVTAGLLQPQELFRFDPERDDFDGERVVVTQQPARFDASGCRVELMEARSDDGTMVPYHVALPPGEGPHPVVVDSYGGYGFPTLPFYLSTKGRLYLERGIGYALAHIRGGGEFGPAWHRAAIKHSKHKSYEDCAAVARDLVERGLAPASGVGMIGASNGGLLAAVMATRYPELFGAVAAIVPVMDMLRYHLFPAGRAWMDEYGDPDDPDDATYLRSYSPWHQVRPASEVRYPPVLVDAPINDDRVDPSHARRFAHRLREAGQPVWLRTAGTGGHGGGDSSHALAANAATRAAFFRRTLLDG